MRVARVPAVLACLVAALAAPAADDLQAFPAPDPGMVRHVLQLPPQDDEALHRVELLVGRTEQVDERNRYFFGGRVEEETIEGWGYTRYLLRQLGPLAGTRMAVEPNAPRVERFVTLGGEPSLVRYNSRLPLVVYTPDGVEVRYRIWTAGPRMPAIPPG